VLLLIEHFRLALEFVSECKKVTRLFLIGDSLKWPDPARKQGKI
jgi:hypothetical protein